MFFDAAIALTAAAEAVVATLSCLGRMSASWALGTLSSSSWRTGAAAAVDLVTEKVAHIRLETKTPDDLKTGNSGRVGRLQIQNCLTVRASSRSYKLKQHASKFGQQKTFDGRGAACQAHSDPRSKNA